MNNETNNPGGAIIAPRKPPLFELGSVVATRAAFELVTTHDVNVANLLEKHQRGEWGATLPVEDAQANELAVQHGGRIFSAYVVAGGLRIWVITEADRSSTTILLPEDY